MHKGRSSTTTGNDSADQSDENGGGGDRVSRSRFDIEDEEEADAPPQRRVILEVRGRDVI